MSDIAKAVGKRLRSCRQGLGLSQEKLAEQAGLHPTYIGQVERGEKNLTIESLEKITKALDYPIAEVFEKIEGRTETENYPLLAYNLVSSRSKEDQVRLYGILRSIEELSGK